MIVKEIQPGTKQDRLLNAMMADQSAHTIGDLQMMVYFPGGELWTRDSVAQTVHNLKEAGRRISSDGTKGTHNVTYRYMGNGGPGLQDFIKRRDKVVVPGSHVPEQCAPALELIGPFASDEAIKIHEDTMNDIKALPVAIIEDSLWTLSLEDRCVELIKVGEVTTRQISDILGITMIDAKGLVRLMYINHPDLVELPTTVSAS